MNKILPALFLALAFGAANAQNANVNPYSGVPLELERVKNEIELTKNKVILNDEKTKLQVSEHHLSNADKIAKATLSVKLKDSGGAAGAIPAPFLTRGDMPAPLPPEFTAPTKQVKKPVKDTKVETKPATMPVPVAPVQSGPNLAAVIDRGSDRVALFEMPGGPLNAKVGTAIPGLGTIKEITAKSVLFSSGQTVSVKGPVAVADVDKQLVGAGGTGSPTAQPQQASAANSRTIVPPASIPN